MQSVLILSVEEERRERMMGKERRENKETDCLLAFLKKSDQMPILYLEVCSSVLTASRQGACVLEGMCLPGSQSGV